MATDGDEDPDLLAIADELYALPLPEFTPARDARAKELKGTEVAPHVKKLRKPSLGAWAVNLLVRRETAQVEQVLDIGAALRQAQEGMSGEELRALTRQRRQLTAAVTQQARALAHDEGVRLTQSVADQVEATLTAAMVSECCGAALRSGLLVTTLTATGVDDADPADAVAVPEALGHRAAPRTAEPPPRPELHVVPDPDADAKARQEAQERLDEAEEGVERARREADEAHATVEELEARQLQIESEIDELRRRIASLEETYDEVDDDLGDAEEARDSARSALTEAEAERDAAARALEKLD